MAKRITAYFLLSLLFLIACEVDRPSKTKLLDFGFFAIEVPNGWHKFELESNLPFAEGLLTDNGDTLKIELDEKLNILSSLGDSLQQKIGEDIVATEREIIGQKKAKVFKPEKSGEGFFYVFIDSLIGGSGSNLSLLFSSNAHSAKAIDSFLLVIKSISFNLFNFKPHSLIKEKMARFITHCDSVFIFQIGPTKEFGMKIIRDFDTTKSNRPDSFPSNQPIYRNGRFNWDLPQKMVKLGLNGRKELNEILLSDAQIQVWGAPRCSDYLHMVAFFYENKTDFIALNFCNESIRVSPEWGIDDSMFDEVKFKKLRKFFRNCGIDPNDVFPRVSNN